DPLALPERAGELPERMQPEVPERVAPGFVGREALPEWVRASNRILELAARGPIYPDMISPAERPLYQRLVLSGLLDEAPDGTFRLTDVGESVLAVRRARQAGTAPTRLIPPERRLPARTEGSPIITPPPPGSVLPPERVDIVDPELLAAERTPGAGRPRPRPAEAGPEALRGPGPGEEPPPTGGAPAPRPRPQGPPPGTPGRRARPRTPEEQAERDVTARRLREERRRRIEAEQNRVTGLPGRQPFERARSRIEADPKGRIGLVDVNNFKVVNDRRGME